MSTRDLLLLDLYHTQRDPQTLALVARCAPVLYFDANEPFLPLAAGYTLFNVDGASPSSNRTIELRLEDGPPAALAIEYAIWWDWDIHHLYELEHVWVYLDENHQPIRVEASWHGKYYDIPLRLEGGRPVLLSEPGKHAFAPHPSWFAERASQVRRVETQAVGAQAGVLVNHLFAGKIRRRAFDATLARSYLYKEAFNPSWDFSKRFTFAEESLVPWPALQEWIPLRVNAWLERLETGMRQADYRALRLVSAEPSPAGLRAAGRASADAVILPLTVRGNRLLPGETLDIDETLQFCQEEPMGAFLQPVDAETVERLAWFVRSNELQSYAVVTSADAGLVARYRSYVPESLTVIQILSPDQNPLQAAHESGAVYINPRWENLPDRRARLTPQWVERVHAAGLGVVSWPVEQPEEAEILQRLGVDVLWYASPQNLIHD